MKHLAIVVCLGLMITAGCGGKPAYNPEFTPAEQSRLEPTRVQQELESDEIVQPDESSRARTVLASTAELRVQSDKPESVHQRTIDLALTFGGYVLTSTTKTTTIRILSRDFHQVLDSVEMYGRITKRKLATLDRTEQWRDLQIRLENALQARERYLELLAVAKNSDEAIRVEKELARLNGTIDNLKKLLNDLHHQVQYSTISVTTTKRVKPGPLGWAFVGPYEAVKWLFVKH